MNVVMLESMMVASARLNPAAQKLLNLFPAPNQDGLLNYHTVTTTTSQLDDVNLRLVKTFGAAAQRGGRGLRARGGGAVDKRRRPCPDRLDET